MAFLRTQVPAAGIVNSNYGNGEVKKATGCNGHFLEHGDGEFYAIHQTVNRMEHEHWCHVVTVQCHVVYVRLCMFMYVSVCLCTFMYVYIPFNISNQPLDSLDKLDTLDDAEMASY